MHHAINIRDPLPADERQWRDLWAGYCSFYNADVSEEITRCTWRRMIDPASNLHGRIAGLGDGITGFSIYVLHEATWTLGMACYLEDLFVTPEARGMGIGRALIDDLVELGQARGWATLYWHTKADNATARRLYDTFCAADDFVRYRMALDLGK